MLDTALMVSVCKQFKPIMDEVKDELGVTMNYSAKGDHEHEAERNIETIKERV
jgi:hypothetical protein